MNELIFKDFTYARLPSGTYLFFPSLEQRTAEEKGEWLTIVRYDTPPYWSGSRNGSALHASLEEGDFERLERSISEGDLTEEPLVVRYALGGEGELTELSFDRKGLEIRRQTDIRGLRGEPERPPAAKRA